MSRHARRRLNLQVYEEACDWFVRFRTGALEEPQRREFDQCLRRSPEFLRAYLEMTAIWNEAAKLDPNRRWDSASLIAAARVAGDEVVELEPMAARSAPQRRTWARTTVNRWWVGAALAAAVLAAIIGSVYHFGAETFATTTGEQRMVTLSDGSTADLNTQSKIEVRYGAHERSVRLLKGEALFHVAKNALRPFVVSSGNAQVRAVGTEFDVYARPSATVVSVLEGRVEVDAPSHALGARGAPSVSSASAGGATRTSDHAVLAAGYRLVVTGSGIGQSTRVDPAAAIAWTQQQLVFDASPVADIAEEFNRYNARSLIIEGNLKDVRLSGVFSTANPMAFVHFLQDRFGARVSESSSEIRVSN